MSISLIRASHANEFELQNYAPLTSSYDLSVITSQHPLTPLSLPSRALWSPTDLPPFPFRRQLLNRLLGGEQWLLGLEKVLTRNDIVHTAETYTPYTHQVVLLRRARKIKKLICTCWETIPHNNEKFSRLRYWKKEAYHYVDLFHTPTHLAKKALIAEGVPPSKIKVIPYGVDTARFAPRPPAPRRQQTKPLILTVARQSREKGTMAYVQARRALGHLANFSWVDNVPYTQIPSVYQAATLFFLPSQSTPLWEEQYGMVLVEAMASGLPIVTTTSGAIPEVVGDAALLAAPSDTAQMITHLRRLLTNPAHAAALSKAGRSRALSLDIRRTSRRLASLYSS